ncbi:hypothetical protein FH972_022797 [Carpinus fangiana]|uniref:Bromo domain-containing protein n=1 Tax=Carpinus fangiana TaxID=176857 RepID=A0A5N6KTA9_9ROSI|nr:hypothetical protein FH972_022797 [Carpinus fangiana]
MAPERVAQSSTPVPTTENDQATQPAAESTVTPEQHDGMQSVLDAVYAHRQEDGHDPSELFHRKVNKRYLPDYYDVIKEPVALSTIKSKIAKREYSTFAEYVRDFALIPHNAQVYNRPDAGAYHDGLEIKRFIQEEFKKLVENNVITAEVAALPYLGEIPQVEDAPSVAASAGAPAAEPDEEDEVEDEEEQDDDDEEGEDTDDSRGKPRKRGRPRKSDIARREMLGSKEDPSKLADMDARKKRGRPPRVDTPMESRIKNIMKAMRKIKNSDSTYMIYHFDRLPDKAAMPEYFNEIKNPMAVDVIKKKQKRKKYQSVEQFMADVELMFENAKRYNEDDSQIYKDAVILQAETRKLAAEEIARPDTDFVMEDGRIPLPNGVLHNGELWKVGDWIHLANPNDLTKPIPAQIYRTWQDASGSKFINACWYYRPEQTVHRFDRHFFDNEIVKTGQYRDHSVDEIVDRCFVMFITRYSKGRPRNFPGDKEIYVCESRYNDEKHTFNKIKTWASCLPDEVRDKDYEMDIFPEVKKLKKMASPIAYLLKDEQKDTDDFPKAEWGSDNAPPKIGAVHRRPRDAKDSPPPEPTPSPPPREPTPPPPPQPRPVPNAAARTPNSFGQRPNQHALNAASRPNVPTPQSAAAPMQRPYQPQASPAARPIPGMGSGYSAHGPQTNTVPRPQQASNYAPQNRYQQGGTYSSGNYQAPQPIEVYTLNDAGNAAIPLDIREQFHRDEYGRVLFFTSPPLDVLPPRKEGAAVGHSARYLAAKIKRDKVLKEKRKRDEDEREAQEQERAKARKLEAGAHAQKAETVRQKALGLWQQQLREATEGDFKSLYGEQWKAKMDEELARANV